MFKLRSSYRMGIIFGAAKISNIFGVGLCSIFLIFMGGKQ